MKEYDAYLFDADGTILDTRELIYRSYVHMGEALGLALPDRAGIEATIGLTLRNALRTLLGDQETEEYYQRANEAYVEYMNRHYAEFLRAFPGTAETLAELRRRGKTLAVVTSRRRRTLERFLRHLDLDGYFSLLVTPEDTERHKPHPDPALLAMEKLGVAPDRTVFIGDAIFDIECGSGAGTGTVLVEWGGMDPAGWAVQPDFIAREFADLLPE